MSGANYREADFPGVRAAGRHNNSITTKELTECDREPVHLIANVQGGTGHLLFIHYPSGKILAHDRDIEHIPWIRCHENRTVTAGRTGARTTSSFHGEQQSGESPHEAIGISGGFLLNWVPHDFYEKILDLVLGIIHSDTHRNFYFYSYDGSAYAISISATEMDYSVIGIEIETVGLDDTASHFSSSLLHLGRIVEFYQHEAIAKTACDTVFHLLGKYDRGMVYRFHDDLSGEVVHEIKANHVESSYLGMRFPSSDIPLPSRQLYIKNGVRYIYDVDTEDLPILSLDNEKMDLSQIRMRAVAKPHIVYLRNMGVVSSLSLAIVVDNDLWGLLAFHGYGARYKPSLHQRIACETISAMVSVRIESLMKKAQSARIIKLGQCTMSLKHDQSLIHNLYEWGEGILEIVDGDVLVAHVQDPRDGEGDRIVLGDPLLVPKDSFWTKMSSYQNRELCVISTRKALTDIKLTQEECPASGIVFFQEGRTQIMIGRAMRSKDVVWAGNPDEPKLRIGGILNPRNSFTQFIEKARKESRAWTVQDISVISVLRDRICEHSYAYMMGLLRGDIQDANRKYLAAIDRARDNYEFFAHMSHELRTPFHGVMGCLSILHESIEDMPAAEVRDVVDTAIASGNHMINLLNDILDISKNKHLSHISAQDKVIYQTLAFETIDCMKSLATSRKIEMRSSIEPKGLEKVVIVTDRTKIIQIVSNVVNNAIKFTGEGTVDVVFRLVDSLQEATMMWERGAEVHAGSVFSMKESEMHTSAEEVRRSTMTFNETHDQKWMTMSVSDTGCGMEPCELVEMFSPYTQSSHGSNRIFQGTGLGLFICVSLCYQLNGFISCASTPDKGTLFHMGIPVGLLAEDTVEGNQTLTDDTKETESVIQMSGPILIVDDNVVNVKILNRALLLDIRRAGLAIEVLTAGGGAEGVQVFRDKRPSLCIIDYHMPDVDGIEATCTIRKYEQENKIDPTYILMYTADATEQAKALILSSGVNDIMSKPPPKGFIAGLVQRLRVPE